MSTDEAILGRMRGRRLLMDEVARIVAIEEGAHRLHSDLERWVAGHVAAGRLQVIEGMRRSWWKGWKCGRCGAWGSRHVVRVRDCLSCGRAVCAYCVNCLAMGHVRRCGRLIEVVEADACAGGKGFGWNGQGFAERFGLTVAQRDAVEGVRRAFREGQDSLLWAVTGAGKTEMLFPLIAEALACGQRVCVATPRRDVVLELVPRLRRAFPDVDIVELHGACADPYAAGPLVVATTHQLLRFRAAFDLLVVDELDAFPFAGSRTLARAARLAADRPAARRLWLTATPSPWLRLRARLRLGRLRLVRVPARFHGHPLPVPVPVAAAPQNLLAALLRSHQRGAQSFVFVPFVRDVAPLVDLLRTKLPAPLRVSGTSARDDQRASTVERFRANLLDVLVTTTILERGVTVPTVDVHVWHADARTFTATALVQIAGRAGRSAHDAPHATVTFYADEPTLAIARARSHIRATNRLAARRGYLR